jgi:hypothetical protein
MTLPDERYNAVIRTRQLLLNLTNPQHTPRVPKLVRQEALYCLRHFPTDYDMKRAEELAPQVFEERMEPVYRMVKQYNQDKEQ